MTPVRIGQTISVAPSLLILLAAPAALAQSSVKPVFEKYDMLGTFAPDCSKPASNDNPYFISRVLEGDRVQRDRMSGPTTRDFAAVLDKAAEVKPNEVTVSGTLDGKPTNIVWRIEDEQIQQWEASVGGEKLISGGRLLSTGREMPPLHKCSQKFTIRSSPDGGGKCIDVPNGDARAGTRLQMWDCNNTPAQTFSFDATDQRLKIGNLCVSAGGGQPGGRVELAPCNNEQNQTWQMGPSGNYVQLAGVNGLCFDIQNSSKENGAPLQLWRCYGGPNQSWTLYQGLDFTYDEGTNREGNTIREFNLEALNPKLCQSACIQEEKCTAWVYLGPEGRTDRQPHCWLRNNITKIERGSSNVVTSGRVRSEARR